MNDPWTLSADGFAGLATPRARLLVLAGHAILAPSSHNTQPWRFRLGADRLDLLADRSRALPVVDPEDRALVISCGAALGHLRVAAEALGQGLDVTLLPDPAEPDLLARIRPGPACAPHRPELLAAIHARRTTRAAFTTEALAQPLPLAEAPGVTLHWRTAPAERHAIAELVAEGDRAQMADPGFRGELAAWVRSRHAASRDGMSGAAFGMPDLLSFVGAMAIRRFDMGAGQAAHDMALAENSPALGVLTTPGDTPLDWLRAGEALSRAILALTAAGLKHSYLNQPIEVPALRPKLAALLGTREFPQMLMRAGHGPDIRPSVRRPLEEVLAEA
ncbi:Acg family FMN-binding oxidoreductase [Roseococcus microcysteis]|uniref:Acg family FMN-binding oxidoreductase n=1 Tax=Roseococcus microcysteis TaxID=2771361 RepID=UPI00168A92AE|nr:hypothetical protein [Roseococcus microcysteis]